MARAVVNPLIPSGGTPNLPLAALSAALVFQAADVVNFNATPSTGRELIIAMNKGVAAQTVTINSAPDAQKRLGDEVAYSLPIGSVTPQFAVFGPFPVNGWHQADGNLWFQGSTVDISFAVVQLPAVS